MLEFCCGTGDCCGAVCSGVSGADEEAPVSLLRAVRALSFSLSMEGAELKP